VNECIAIYSERRAIGKKSAPAANRKSATIWSFYAAYPAPQI
jgi:hypothetical protein